MGMALCVVYMHIFLSWEQHFMKCMLGVLYFTKKRFTDGQSPFTKGRDAKIL